MDFSSDDSLKDPSYSLPKKSRKQKFQEVSIDLADDSSSSSCSKLDEVKGANQLLFENFYKIVEKRAESPFLQKAGGIIAECLLCRVKIKASLLVSSNLISHLRGQHPDKFKLYMKEKNNLKSTYPKELSTFDEKILAFLAETYSPLSIVDNPAFVALFEGTNLKIKSRRTYTELLKQKYNDCKFHIIKTLKETPYYCTTADIWSAGRRSFFGYTCHWIDEISFQRRSKALACRRFSGAHTYDKIAEMINDIHKIFEMDVDKIQMTITDNGSNFLKAFREYGVTEFAIDAESDIEDDAAVELDDQGVEFTDINIILPQHFRCASHTPNLLSTTDYLKIIKSNDSLLSRHKNSFKKCSGIWNKCNRPKSAEIIKDLLSCSLKTPTVTRWNSLYDVIIMTPIANALDFLQGEKNMYFGYFIAVMVSLKVKLQKIPTCHNLKDLTFACAELVNCLLNRFKVFFEVGKKAEDAIVAAICCPNIKMKIVPVLQETAPQMDVEKFKQMFVRHAAPFCPETLPEERDIAPNDSFLDFGESESTQATVQNDARRELELYLLDPDTSMSSLKSYLIVQKVFLKYNTAIPSSAPVERLFSFAGMVNAPRRRNVSDENF